MRTKRRLAAVAFAAASVLAASPGAWAAASAGPAAYVNPFVGTAAGAPNFGTGGGAGNTFPGAVAPFGMLAWSPQTVPSTVNFAADYTYTDRQMSGFALTHLSGAGCAAAGDISFLPTTHPVDVSPATFGSSSLDAGYLASFSHREESAHPGYYRVVLDPDGASAIATQLTAAPRAGAGLFTFPAKKTGSVLINAGASANADTAASVRIDPATRTVTGSASSGRFCYQENHYTVYFAARFDRPFATYGTWRKQLLMPGATSSSDSDPGALNYTPFPGGPRTVPGNPSGTAQAGAYLTFDTAAHRAVAVRVGLSYVSSADALQNLDAEAGTGTFEALKARDTAAWNRALGRITVSGATRRDRRTFYTALYHAMLEPSIFSDVNGRYEGMDGRVHTIAKGHVQYANFSEWDIYRSDIPLLSMLEPSRASDMVQSLVNDAQQSGWLPKWPVADGQTDVMTGDSSDPIIAEAYAFGARQFDTRAALSEMIRGATSTGVGQNGEYIERPGLLEYERLGYVPQQANGSSTESTLTHATPWGSVSTTLEYTTDDFAISQFAARAACDAPDYRQFLHRSSDWTNVFDPALRLMASRSADGTFTAGAAATTTQGFVEGDALQYTWMVPFDLRQLFRRMGGRTAALHRLNAFFTKLNTGPASTTAFLGNEPTLEAPWEYDWLRAPYRTQSVVRRALLSLYAPTPGGMPGNDDLGEMSSWYVFGAIGLYPEIPGTPVLALGSPLFPHTVLHLGRHRLTITAPGAHDTTPYVHALTVGGRRYGRPWISFAALVHEHSLRFTLGSEPDRTWGASARDIPPSFPTTAAVPQCHAAP